jgi:hypothetical protein
MKHTVPPPAVVNEFFGARLSLRQSRAFWQIISLHGFLTSDLSDAVVAHATVFAFLIPPFFADSD